MARSLQQALGHAIRTSRGAKGYSQESFAHRVGLHRTYIGGIERGERNVSLANLERLAAALEVRLSELIKVAEDDSAKRAQQK